MVCCVAAVWSLTTTAGAASEESGSSRVLVVESNRSSMLERVTAELTGLGFTVVRRAASGSLDDMARAEHASAAIRVLPSRKGVEVWMADATSGRSLLRQVIVDEDPNGPNERLIALQTAELLRTSLLAQRDSASHELADPPKSELPPNQAQNAAVIPPEKHRDDAPAASDSVAPRAGSFRESGMQAWLGALYSPGGAGAGLQLGLSLQHSLSERWGLLLDLSAPLRSANISSVEGSASVGASFAGVGVFTRIRAANHPYIATLGAALALMRIGFDGDARVPLQARDEHVVTGAAYLRADAAVEPLTWLRLGVRGTAGATAERVRVQFAGNDSGSWGPGFFALFGLCEVALR
ncbi:MAG TPA: hypothetical protein VFQ61_13610 [Polyangiaceae bacterium]|nr:hypothetical protein [Polyangiaceae bacterium]